MKKLKPIETKYKGYRFRSRLEARWAVFFDQLDIKWEYEFFSMPCCFDACNDADCYDDRKIPLTTEDDIRLFDMGLISDAIKEARSARFEHGENGLTHIGSIVNSILYHD